MRHADVASSPKLQGSDREAPDIWLFASYEHQKLLFEPGLIISTSDQRIASRWGRRGILH